ncbi:hypothetical protein BFV94_4396 [Alteromonas macleodii]|uniref:Uncharacterized protein n=2 Tax=Alteromonas macleodii TaxID=28108 RepID=A0AB36FKR4_ALTMA|nr:hypothetical protein BFV95_4753 [Alteromonas macleodii]OES25543.1 hypothetical protein BFV94_4396 [Alteromonas macleodii]OES25844.1 hypothetical protein BFV93_4307 [Alteromonas macleodii]OES38634.1 hypothetical protein BFV96_4745 [Alteromonas macleodii]
MVNAANQPAGELTWMNDFIAQFNLDTYKCEFVTTTGTDTPGLIIAVPAEHRAQIEDAYFDYAESRWPFYYFAVRKLGFFECWFTKKQLNIIHNNNCNRSWDAQLLARETA